MTRWLVTGATGLLGSNAALRLSSHHEVICTARSRPLGVPLEFMVADLLTKAGRDGLVEKSGARAILHAAALASIEACANDPELADELNVTVAAELARQASVLGAAFVYISTDAVFDGTKGAYAEDDVPSPTSVYGRSKLAGERAVLEANPNALVARVNFYGWSPSGERSLAEFFFNNLIHGHTVPGFTDTVVSTMFVDLLVDALADLSASGANGVVNVVSSEAICKFEFGRLLAVRFGFDPELVVPATSAEYLKVSRGSQMSLDTTRVERLLGRQMPSQKEGIERLKAALDTGVREHLRVFDTRNGKLP